MIAEEGSKALRILLTNDDGIDAEGLHLLEELALGISQDVTVVARATTVTSCEMPKASSSNRCNPSASMPSSLVSNIRNALLPSSAIIPLI